METGWKVKNKNRCIHTTNLKEMGVKKRLLKLYGTRNRGLWIYIRAIKMYSRTKNNTNIKIHQGEEKSIIRSEPNSFF